MTPTPRTVAARAALLRHAREVIEREYATDLQLPDVAARVFVSRRQLQRCFSDTGTTFRDYVTAVRMRRAAELLGRQGARIRDIAHAVGYEQPAQFAKAFRRVYGVSPGEFRAVGRGADLPPPVVPVPAPTPPRDHRRAVAPPRAATAMRTAKRENLLLDAIGR